jgi:sulfite reductase (ferredoxin)
VLTPDPRWTGLIQQSLKEVEKPSLPAAALKATSYPKGFLEWRKTNIYPQPQYGYVVVYVKAPLGDLTAPQMRVMAGIARKYTKESVRTTVEQNLAFRWIREADLPAIYDELGSVGLNTSGFGTITDITSCPGTDTCKLGISASRALSRELIVEYEAKAATLPEEVKNLRIKVSGCPNSCSQHHVSDLGFYGVSRKSGSYAVPHFQLVIGGQRKNNGEAYGLAVAAVPSKRVPEAIERLTQKFSKERQKDENFQSFVRRLGKVEIKNLLQDLTVIPAHDFDPDLYTDWADPREYTIADIGKGECAGEVVSPYEFSLTAAESKVFEAQVELEKQNLSGAVDLAYQSFIHSAEAVLRTRDREYTGKADQTVADFKKFFFDTGEFVKHVNNTQFAAYLFKAHDNRLPNANADEAHHRVEEAQLFLEAVHSYVANMPAAPSTPSAASVPVK